MQLDVNYLNEILIFVIFACSLNLLMGYAGQVSVAHGAFAAFGGYALAYLFLHDKFDTLAGLGVGVGAAALAGLVVGFPALRLRTEWLILLTLAAQIIVIELTMTLSNFGGTYGLQNVAGLSVFGQHLLLPTDMLPLFAACAVLVFLLCWRLGESPYGRVLRAIREDEGACRSLGKNVYAYKLTIFAITAAMAGLGGALYVVTLQISSPALFSFDLSTAIIAMVIFGGMGNLFGSVLGATILTLLTPLFENALDFTTAKAAIWRLIAYGIVLVVVIMVRPQGLLPEGAAPIRFVRHRVARARARGHEPRPAATVPVLAGTPGRAGALGTHEGIAGAARPPSPVALDGSGTGQPVLVVTGLTKRFGGITAANDLALELRSGTITALVGPNGAGKTTVFSLLTGETRPDAGRVLLHGEDITGLRPDQVAGKGMVRSFQNVRVFPRLSALTNVCLAIQDQPGEHIGPLFLRIGHSTATERRVRARAMEWLSFVGMAELADQPAGGLAFGQQKLVALARVLATDAEVILLDEPASGIDEQWVDVMLGLIERLRPQGRTVCIVEHNLRVVSRLADQVYFMELGKITAQGTFDELIGDPRLTEAYFGTG